MLIVNEDGPVLRLTLDRPEVRNAFNDVLIGRLFEAIRGISDQTRAIVIAGSGQSFCAGGDLQWMQQASTYTEAQNFEDALKLAKLFEAMVTSPAVIIARVHGAAFGGGCGIVAAADVAIASENAQFAFSEVRLGLVPATISPFVIPKIGHGHARALFSTGEAFGATRALQIGLVHEVVSSELLDETVDKKLKAVLTAGPKAVAAAKALAQSPPMNLEDAATCLAKIRASDEGKEGVTAFLEPRAPSYKVDR